ncbi:SLC13 family permease [Chloroflexota bacterium]
MNPVMFIALAIFVAAIALIIWGRVDRTAVSVGAVVLMVVLGVMDEREAFFSVDWNVIAILFGVWIIAAYFGRTGIPEYLARLMLRISGHRIGVFLTLMGVLAGFISIFVDNVVVIIMLAPVVLHVTKRLNVAAFPFLIFIGLCSNFMGTALLLGDLPPQMLHSVAGIEFPEFIWQFGRPSSFIILTLTFIPTVLFLYYFKFRKMYRDVSVSQFHEDSPVCIENAPYAVVVVGIFIATILGMAFRQYTGLHLGLIAIAGMIILVLTLEIFHTRLKGPKFENILADVDLRTMLFYISLFVLVGGIDKAGFIQIVANAVVPFVQNNLVVGTSVIYWLTAAITGVVEHDAYILSFLYVIRDVAEVSAVNPWPLWWAVLWAGTLGSNLTIAGAPALFVSQNICEKENNCIVRPKQFFSETIPFVIISLVICYILMMIFWVLPFSR